MPNLQDGLNGVKPEDVIDKDNRGEAQGNFRVVLRPPIGKKQRGDREGGQKEAEWQYHPRVDLGIFHTRRLELIS
jgi:hypothetical protein